jgi:choline kinase
MKVIVLAAGRGSRMGPQTLEKHKTEILIHGKALIVMAVSNFHKCGLLDIGIVTGYKARNLRKYNLKEIYNDNWSKTNILASLLCAKAWLKDSDFLVSYSDIFFGTEIIEDLKSSNADIAVGYDINWLRLWKKRFENPLSDAEQFRINDHDVLEKLGGKASSIEEIQGQFMGLIKFSSNGWNIFEKFLSVTFDSNEIDSLDIALNVHPVIGIPNREPWGEIDTFTDWELYNESIH